VSVADAAGRVLAVPPEARLTQPPTDLSAMDGYAVRAADVPAVPTTLTLVGQAPAGGSYDHALQPGEAVRIFTGGPLPMGADSIVIQEDTQADGATITILEAPRPGRHVRKAGLDFSAGDTPLQPGRTLTTRDLALAAAMNHPWLSVHRKPRVAILSTGDELVMPGEPVGRNQIVSSSGHCRRGAGARLGRRADPVRHRPRRSLRLIESRIAAGTQHDLLITLGGASVGDHDLVQGALKAQGFDDGFLEDRHAPGQAADVRGQATAPACSACRGIRSRRWSARCSVPEARPGADARAIRRTGPNPACPPRESIVKAERPARGLCPLPH
jgi:molybdopterin molybdotransferase